MPRNIACTALIAGGVTAALFSIGAAGIALAPPASSSVLGDFLHIVIASLPRTVTPERFLILCIGWTLGVAVIAALVAWLGTAFLTEPEPSQRGVARTPTGRILRRV
jgi:hypothetical protein